MEIKNNNIERGRYELSVALKEGEMLLEPHYNAALWAFKTGDYQEAISYIKKSLKIYPEHADSHMLMKNIEEVIKIM